VAAATAAAAVASAAGKLLAMTPTYLDYNATTPLDPAVIEGMLPFLHEHFGNPSSTHEYGRRAHEAVESARASVSALLGARPEEIVFTSGGTEASNQAIKGAVFSRVRGGLAGLVGRLFARTGAHLVITAIEHPATTKPAEFLQKLG